MAKSKFKLDGDLGWVCESCGSSDVQDNSPDPNVEEVYQEVPSGFGDSVEKLVPVATEHYLDLTCNDCGEHEFEAL